MRVAEHVEWCTLAAGTDECQLQLLPCLHCQHAPAVVCFVATLASGGLCVQLFVQLASVCTEQQLPAWNVQRQHAAGASYN